MCPRVGRTHSAQHTRRTRRERPVNVDARPSTACATGRRGPAGSSPRRPLLSVSLRMRHSTFGFSQSQTHTTRRLHARPAQYAHHHPQTTSHARGASGSAHADGMHTHIPATGRPRSKRVHLPAPAQLSTPARPNVLEVEAKRTVASPHSMQRIRHLAMPAGCTASRPLPLPTQRSPHTPHQHFTPPKK